MVRRTSSHNDISDRLDQRQNINHDLQSSKSTTGQQSFKHIKHKEASNKSLHRSHTRQDKNNGNTTLSKSGVRKILPSNFYAKHSTFGEPVQTCTEKTVEVGRSSTTDTPRCEKRLDKPLSRSKVDIIKPEPTTHTCTNHDDNHKTHNNSLLDTPKEVDVFFGRYLNSNCSVRRKATYTNRAKWNESEKSSLPRRSLSGHSIILKTKWSNIGHSLNKLHTGHLAYGSCKYNQLHKVPKTVHVEVISNTLKHADSISGPQNVKKVFRLVSKNVEFDSLHYVKPKPTSFFSQYLDRNHSHVTEDPRHYSITSSSSSSAYATSRSSLSREYFIPSPKWRKAFSKKHQPLDFVDTSLETSLHTTVTSSHTGHVCKSVDAGTNTDIDITHKHSNSSFVVATYAANGKRENRKRTAGDELRLCSVNDEIHSNILPKTGDTSADESQRTTAVFEVSEEPTEERNETSCGLRSIMSEWFKWGPVYTSPTLPRKQRNRSSSHVSTTLESSSETSVDGSEQTVADVRAKDRHGEVDSYFVRSRLSAGVRYFHKRRRRLEMKELAKKASQDSLKTDTGDRGRGVKKKPSIYKYDRTKPVKTVSKENALIEKKGVLLTGKDNESGKFHTIIPRRDDYKFIYKQRQSIPKQMENSSPREQNNPKEEQNRPKQRQNSPKQRESSPPEKQNSPKHRQNIQKQREISPKQRENSPKQRENSPKQRENSSNQRENRHIQKENSPKQKESSPKHGGNTSKQKENRSKRGLVTSISKSSVNSTAKTSMLSSFIHPSEQDSKPTSKYEELIQVADCYVAKWTANSSTSRNVNGSPTNGNCLENTDEQCCPPRTYRFKVLRSKSDNRGERKTNNSCQTGERSRSCDCDPKESRSSIQGRCCKSADAIGKQVPDGSHGCDKHVRTRHGCRKKKCCRSPENKCTPKPPHRGKPKCRKTKPEPEKPVPEIPPPPQEKPKPLEVEEPPKKPPPQPEKETPKQPEEPPPPPQEKPIPPEIEIPEPPSVDNDPPYDPPPPPVTEEPAKEIVEIPEKKDEYIPPEEPPVLKKEEPIETPKKKEPIIIPEDPPKKKEEVPKPIEKQPLPKEEVPPKREPTPEKPKRPEKKKEEIKKVEKPKPPEKDENPRPPKPDPVPEPKHSIKLEPREEEPTISIETPPDPPVKEKNNNENKIEKKPVKTPKPPEVIPPEEPPKKPPPPPPPRKEPFAEPVPEPKKEYPKPERKEPTSNIFDSALQFFELSGMNYFATLLLKQMETVKSRNRTLKFFAPPRRGLYVTPKPYPIWIYPNDPLGLYKYICKIRGGTCETKEVEEVVEDKPEERKPAPKDPPCYTCKVTQTCDGCRGPPKRNSCEPCRPCNLTKTCGSCNLSPSRQTCGCCKLCQPKKPCATCNTSSRSQSTCLTCFKPSEVLHIDRSCTSCDAPTPRRKRSKSATASVYSVVKSSCASGMCKNGRKLYHNRLSSKSTNSCHSPPRSNNKSISDLVNSSSRTLYNVYSSVHPRESNHAVTLRSSFVERTFSHERQMRNVRMYTSGSSTASIRPSRCAGMLSPCNVSAFGRYDPYKYCLSPPFTCYEEDRIPSPDPHSASCPPSQRLSEVMEKTLPNLRGSSKTLCGRHECGKFKGKYLPYQPDPYSLSKRIEHERIKSESDLRKYLAHTTMLTDNKEDLQRKIDLIGKFDNPDKSYPFSSSVDPAYFSNNEQFVTGEVSNHEQHDKRRPTRRTTKKFKQSSFKSSNLSPPSNQRKDKHSTPSAVAIGGRQKSDRSVTFSDKVTVSPRRSPKSKTGSSKKRGKRSKTTSSRKHRELGAINSPKGSSAYSYSFGVKKNIDKPKRRYERSRKPCAVKSRHSYSRQHSPYTARSSWAFSSSSAGSANRLFLSQIGDECCIPNRRHRRRSNHRSPRGSPRGSPKQRRPRSKVTKAKQSPQDVPADQLEGSRSPTRVDDKLKADTLVEKKSPSRNQVNPIIADQSGDEKKIETVNPTRDKKAKRIAESKSGNVSNIVAPWIAINKDEFSQIPIKSEPQDATNEKPEEPNDATPQDPNSLENPIPQENCQCAPIFPKRKWTVLGERARKRQEEINKANARKMYELLTKAVGSVDKGNIKEIDVEAAIQHSIAIANTTVSKCYECGGTCMLWSPPPEMDLEEKAKTGNVTLPQTLSCDFQVPIRKCRKTLPEISDYETVREQGTPCDVFCHVTTCISCGEAIEEEINPPSLTSSAERLDPYKPSIQLSTPPPIAEDYDLKQHRIPSIEKSRSKLHKTRSGKDTHSHAKLAAAKSRSRNETSIPQKQHSTGSVSEEQAFVSSTTDARTDKNDPSIRKKRSSTADPIPKTAPRSKSASPLRPILKSSTNQLLVSSASRSHSMTTPPDKTKHTATAHPKSHVALSTSHSRTNSRTRVKSPKSSSSKLASPIKSRSHLDREEIQSSSRLHETKPSLTTHSRSKTQTDSVKPDADVTATTWRSEILAKYKPPNYRPQPLTTRRNYTEIGHVSALFSFQAPLSRAYTGRSSHLETYSAYRSGIGEARHYPSFSPNWTSRANPSWSKPTRTFSPSPYRPDRYGPQWQRRV